MIYVNKDTYNNNNLIEGKNNHIPYNVTMAAGVFRRGKFLSSSRRFPSSDSTSFVQSSQSLSQLWAKLLRESHSVEAVRSISNGPSARNHGRPQTTFDGRLRSHHLPSPLLPPPAPLLPPRQQPQQQQGYSSAIPRRLVKEGEPRLKNDALDIYFAGLDAVDPKKAVANVLSRDGDMLRSGF